MLAIPQWAITALTRILIDGMKLYAMAFGVAILLGGPERLGSPSFGVILRWAPYWAWGGSILAFGALALVTTSYALRWLALAFCAAWFWVWDAALVASLLYARDQPLPWTGVPTYAAMASGFTAAAVALWVTRKNWTPRKPRTEHGHSGAGQRSVDLPGQRGPVGSDRGRGR